MRRGGGEGKLRAEVMGAYRALDREIKLLQLRTGLRCPSRCGVCCESPNVETSVLECLPLAYHIFGRGEEERVHQAIGKCAGMGDHRCVLYAADNPEAGLGRCSHYPLRPLVCRLFGYAARRGRTGNLELHLCRVIRGRLSGKEEMSACRDIGVAGPPVYQDAFLKVASLDPGTGFRLMPINEALKEALEHVYWKHPKGRSAIRRAA